MYRMVVLGRLSLPCGDPEGDHDHWEKDLPSKMMADETYRVCQGHNISLTPVAKCLKVQCTGHMEKSRDRALL